MAEKLLFTKVFGQPDPAVPVGIRFASDSSQRAWQSMVRLSGAGYFRNRFLFLFGEGLERLQSCLDAWSFLVPPAKNERVILGYNAYGSLLVVDNAGKMTERVYLLDPFRAVYWRIKGSLLTLVSNWLPRDMIPHFLDDGLYQAWVAGGDYLPEGYVLAPQKPEELGGELVEGNVQPEEIVSYYQTTGPIYAKALAKAAAKKKKPTSKPRTRK